MEEEEYQRSGWWDELGKENRKCSIIPPPLVLSQCSNFCSELLLSSPCLVALIVSLLHLLDKYWTLIRCCKISPKVGERLPVSICLEGGAAQRCVRKLRPTVTAGNKNWMEEGTLAQKKKNKEKEGTALHAKHYKPLRPPVLNVQPSVWYQRHRDISKSISSTTKQGSKIFKQRNRT